jgi:hypothetical protein
MVRAGDEVGPDGFDEVQKMRSPGSEPGERVAFFEKLEDAGLLVGVEPVKVLPRYVEIKIGEHYPPARRNAAGFTRRHPSLDVWQASPKSTGHISRSTNDPMHGFAWAP